MPFGGMLSLGAGAMGLGGGLMGLFGGGSQQPQAPPTYQFGNMGGADQGAFSGTQQLGQYNVPWQLMPQYSGIGQGMVNDPNAGLFQQGAGTAGAMGMGAGINAYNAGGGLMGAANSLTPDVSALISMGFDPQQALYNRTQQQVQDQTRAGLEARGVDMTPYGAGVEGQTMSNFNIDWQNNLLNRASQGAGAAGNLLGQIGQGQNQGFGLQTGGAGAFLQGAGTPYQTSQGIGQNQLSTLQGMGQFGLQGAQIPQQQIGDYLGYLGAGVGAQNSANQNYLGQLQAQRQQFGENQIFGAGIGSGLASIGRNWPSGWGGGPSSMGTGWGG